jgi:hypothetical protein
MYSRLCGLVVTLIGGLAMGACTSDAVLLGDATPLPPGSFPVPRPAPKLPAIPHFTAPQEVASWRHHPEPVGVQQFNQDKAHCTRMANNAPGAASPDMKFYIVFVDCMRSAGYEAGSNL